ncbi:SSS sodium solute transporter superfamily [Emticicia oligotrophica DSM 17448]|uniref:SSS sodium solute transporter superfamily n=1 Tax=Emticicia oligotrophica (strain DSM 17448 / CIP 109782 / MTCC 6937 / GPTSA100-15) TaxID=929562 RepID=A0ABM5MXV8_EMTOG|nr:sodium/sugar symporter [Emticicia oligotrophica]AFK01907.1 SSS sodium solute transporter superfamily [Emticicia oligotrophica DSM 17448]
MTLGLETLDYIIFLVYFIIVSSYGYWIYKNKGKQSADSKDFFLAEGSLTWWAIGASIIASNISAEQFIGMSGQAFQLGIAISVYELLGGVSLLIVAVYFLPMYLNNKIFTMPQFLAKRYDSRLATIMAVFWLFLYIFVNLTSIIYLGGLSLEKMTGFSFMTCAIFLTVFAVIITLGGMKVIGYTDVIQVVCLIFGGLATTYLALDLLSNKVGTGAGVFEGVNLIAQKADSHLHMIFKENQYQVHDGKGGFIDAYRQLPGIMMFIIGGQWVNNLNYFGCNQYMTQRALGADISTARNGVLFAAFMKMLMPIIVVLPGLAAFVIFQENADASIVNGITQNGIVKPDNAYPVLLNLLPVGLKGLAFAALTAAIVASLAGKANSISTIYVLDIHKKFFNQNLTEKQTVWTGRVAIVIAFIIALIVSPLLANFGQAFEYIQVYTGYISPGILSIFLLGFFWKKATANGALTAAVLSIVLSAIIESLYPTFPFMNRMGVVFWICSLVHISISLIEGKGKDQENAFEVNKAWFKVDKSFAIGAVVVVTIFTLIYTIFW